jgi:hypothetical protein
MNLSLYAATILRAGLLAGSLFVCHAGFAADGAAGPSYLTAYRLDGQPVSLADGRGRISLVVFWSPESLPSRKSLSELQRFIKSGDEQKIFTLAISTMQDAEALKVFIASRALDLPVAIRGEDDFGPMNDWRLPRLYVFAGDGRFLRGHAGLFNMKTLGELVGRDQARQRDDAGAGN